MRVPEALDRALEALAVAVRGVRVALDVVPDLETVRVVRTWSGVIAFTDDLSPIVGESASVPGYFACVSTTGFTFSPIFARQVAGQIVSSPLYANPPVKVETQSSGIAAFLEAYRDLIWGMRWLLAPAILITLSLVISNAISISVRERRLEMAVLKVLGFRPGHLLSLVMGEALLIGTLSGAISAAATYWVVNNAFGGLKFPIAFFPVFYIPLQSLWWGIAIGTLTALAGSVLPAWNARSVKVSDVFAKVA